MRHGIFSSPTDKETLALKLAARKLAASGPEIVEAWIDSYKALGMQNVLSLEGFKILCNHEFDRLIKTLGNQQFELYWDDLGKLTNELISKGLSVNALTGLFHRFEESCGKALIKSAPLDLDQIFALATFMRNTLSLVLTQTIESQHSNLLDQVSLARNVEAVFHPKPPPPVAGLEVAALFAPSPNLFDIGGDFYDFFTLPDGRIAFTLGDVSGRGVEAASDAAMTKFMLRSFAAEHALPGKILERTNDALSYFLRADEFVTAICGLYEPESRRLILAAAGHPFPIYVPTGDKPNVVETSGPALGVLPRIVCREWEVYLSPGDLIFIYTDGLLEARAGSEMFGEERIMAAIERHCAESAQHCLDTINKACLDFCDGALSDDLTALALRAAAI